VKANVLPNTLSFEGVLDEQTSEDSLLAILEEVKRNGLKPPLIIDLSKVSYANSRGGLVWLKFGRAAGVPLKYVNAPVWLINQFNMITDYFINGSFVETMMAPYFAPQTGDSRSFMLKVGVDFPLMADYSDFTMPNRNENGKIFEPDFEPARYFHFITNNFKKFKEACK
jgi:hypothetical protein